MRHYELDSTETVIAAWDNKSVGYNTLRKVRREAREWVGEITDRVDWRVSVFEEPKQTPPNADDDES